MGVTLLGIALAYLLHEGGHCTAAFCFGHALKFRRTGLRFVWGMPDVEPWKQRIIALAGFGTELLAVPIFIVSVPELALWYAVVAVLHFIAYPFYANEYNDFRWLR